jgi:hypothetical protein
MDDDEERAMRPRQLFLPRDAKGGVTKVDTGALLDDRARALLRALVTFGAVRQVLIFHGTVSIGYPEFHRLGDFVWPRGSPASATDVTTAEGAWKELAILVPGLVVRDSTADEKGKSLAELYPRAVRSTNKVIDLFGAAHTGSKKKPPCKGASVIPIRPPVPAVRSKSGDSEPPPGAA